MGDETGSDHLILHSEVAYELPRKRAETGYVEASVRTVVTMQALWIQRITDIFKADTPRLLFSTWEGLVTEIRSSAGADEEW